jgi:competence protein ComEA
MDSDHVKSIIKQNLLPIFLASAGFFLLLFGIIQIFMHSQSSSASDFVPVSDLPKEVQTQQIMIDVEGAVINPGVYKMNSDSRTVDALAAAGGMSEEADREYVQKNINLAQKVSDGLKIYVPRVGEEVKSAFSSNPQGSAGPVININTASEAQLDSLSGVGQVTAGKIIDGRPYSDPKELLDKKIVGQATFDKIKDQISAN